MLQIKPKRDSLQVKMSRERAEEVIEQIMRDKAGQKAMSTARIPVTREMVQQVIASRKGQRDIGTSRTDKVRGWLAQQVEKGGIDQRWVGRKSTSVWLSPEETTNWSRAAEAAWAAQGDDPAAAARAKSLADREKAVSAAAGWMDQNEEQARNGVKVMRPEKIDKMRRDRKGMWAKLGGIEAMWAAIAIMVLLGMAVPLTDRGAGGVREQRARWVEESIVWAENAGWLYAEEKARAAERARQRLAEMRERMVTREGRPTGHAILDMGEGWGSIGIAAAEMKEGCYTVGVDRAVNLDQGSKYGRVTAKVQADFAVVGKVNLLRRVSRQANTEPASFLLIWLSPECTILSACNTSNQGTDGANGLWVLSAEAVATMTAGVRENKTRELEECLQAIEAQMAALEAEEHLGRGLLFALENPMGSDLWTLPSVADRIKRNAGWTLTRVDQCAYGRPNQKPSYILHNLGSAWQPTGVTGTGKCVRGACGGTCKKQEGWEEGKHEQQLGGRDAKRRVKRGEVTGPRGRREYSTDAARNLVEKGLVQEIVRAAIGVRQAQGKTQRRTHKHKAQNNTQEQE